MAITAFLRATSVWEFSSQEFSKLVLALQGCLELEKEKVLGSSSAREGF